MKSICIVVTTFLFSLWFAGCAKTLPTNGVPASKTYEQELDIKANGFYRTYLVHVPPRYDGKDPMPLVVVIHGAFDTATGMEAFSGFSELADQENFLVLYPNGMGLFGWLQHWNAGHCCGKAAKDKIDDVGFIEAAVEDVRSRLRVDPKRVFVVGFSNGGMMAYRFAAEKTHLLAGGAFLAASIGGRPSNEEPEWRIPDPEGPLPVIIMHGMSDQDIPFEGGSGKRRGGPRTYWSVMASVAFWVKNDGCTGNRSEREIHGGRVDVISWKDCAEHTAVSLYKIKGWAHDWPGPYFTGKLPQTDSLRQFDAAKIIWDFFEAPVTP
ncbi:MAG: prolyl oligopeptidase family serine peptidase [Deltaproteobacteria bacterium]|nr:prolyl oligopeptidase family serine peptidase [Deltaproteobacteria bacterium]